METLSIKFFSYNSYADEISRFLLHRGIYVHPCSSFYSNNPTLIFLQRQLVINLYTREFINAELIHGFAFVESLIFSFMKFKAKRLN